MLLWLFGLLIVVVVVVIALEELRFGLVLVLFLLTRTILFLVVICLEKLTHVICSRVVAVLTCLLTYKRVVVVVDVNSPKR